MSRFGDDGEFREQSATMLATVLHLHRGTPYVYQGEELGMTNAPFDRIEDFRDIESLNHYATAVAAGADPDDVLAGLRAMSRDNARTPMQWDATAHAGFTRAHPGSRSTRTTWRSMPTAALADEGSVFHHYRRLIELRHDEPVVAHGDFTMLLPGDPVVYAFTRRLADVELLVLGNFSSAPVTADVPSAAEWAAARAAARRTIRRGRRASAGAAAVGGAGLPPSGVRRGWPVDPGVRELGVSPIGPAHSDSGCPGGRGMVGHRGDRVPGSRPSGRDV